MLTKNICGWLLKGLLLTRISFIFSVFDMWPLATDFMRLHVFLVLFCAAKIVLVVFLLSSSYNASQFIFVFL